MYILGIETSCDETSASIVKDGTNLLSLETATSIKLHRKYGGIVPEIASRKQLELIMPVIDEAMIRAGIKWPELSAISVTYGPGLAGSLLIGVLSAKTLALVFNKPLYGVNHIEAHLYANFISKSSVKSVKPANKIPDFPFLGVIVSGGHSQIVLIKNHLDYTVIGKTLDDAAGEAFDKVAKILGLSYPGGPSISKLSKNISPSITLPLATVGKYDFSFSGLKTAVLRHAQKIIGEDYNYPSYKIAKRLTLKQKQDLAASFQFTAVTSLLKQIISASRDLEINRIVLAGGVAANQLLREELNKAKFDVFYPDINLCTDNAAMVASLGYFAAKTGASSADPFALTINPSLKM